jgi:CRP-like cAMP-binding protein
VVQPTSAILGEVDAGDLQRLETVGAEAEIAAGQMLIEKGQPGSGLYVILDGTVLVEAPDETREFGPGSVLGERALLSPHGVRAARVRAVTDVRVLAVDRIEFERLCSEDPGLAGRLKS